MVITREQAMDILQQVCWDREEDIYQACEMFGCASGDIFPEVNELLMAIVDGDCTID